MTFSQKIDYLMKKNSIKNLSQLANELNIPYTTLWDYYSNPARLEKANISNIRKISKRLNCTIDYLVYDEITNPEYGKNLIIDKEPFNDNERFHQFQLLYDKMQNYPEESQKMVYSITKSVMDEIDEQLDKKE